MDFSSNANNDLRAVILTFSCIFVDRVLEYRVGDLNLLACRHDDLPLLRVGRSLGLDDLIIEGNPFSSYH